VASLSLHTARDFFDEEILVGSLANDLGVDQLEDYRRFVRDYGERFSLPDREYPPWTPTKQLYWSAVRWYWFLVLSPFLALGALLVVRSAHRCPTLLLAVAVWGCLAVATVFSVHPIVRYLHPAAWLTLSLLGILSERFLSLWRRASNRPAVAHPRDP
jgi:hypothetical protein